MSNFFKNLFKSKNKLSIEELITKKTVLSFTVFFVFLAICIIGWNTLNDSTKSNGALQPLRKVLDANEKAFSKMPGYQNMAKTFDKSKAAGFVRVNGNAGLKSTLDSVNWKLQVIKNNCDTLFITLDEIKKLPKTEIIFDFKCIEGWDQISHWGGVKFSDFITHFHLEQEAKKQYIGLDTPDKEYYVGIDMPAALHPQTLLCYEMNGRPLPINQGFPLRVIIPVKYGIKSLKRIGTLFLSDTRPRDYWFERGYDYYSGL